MGLGVEPHTSASILASQTPGQLTFVQLEGWLPTDLSADQRRVLRHFSYFTGMSRGAQLRMRTPHEIRPRLPPRGRREQYG